MPLPSPALATALASLALLSACGRGDGAVTAAAPAAAASAPAAAASAPATAASAPVVVAAASATLSGTVAVGAPISGATLRVLDADGAVVASGVVVDAAGRYADVVLAGPAPYRVEACGYAGVDYRCVYSVAGSAAGGTVNVTPLTTATVLLATGQAPEALMRGTAPALTAAAVDAAQAQLRTGLAGVLAGAGVAADFDFVSGALAAGSRSGYDGVLDAVGVAIGQDASAFVQITPRLGSGNLYFEPGTTLGSVTTAGAAGLQLGGVETLFDALTRAIAGPDACADATSGLRRSMATTARLSLDVEAVVGADAVAAGLCGFFAGAGDGDDDPVPLWGSSFVSPTLGRCDFSGAAPVCGVSFALRSPDGEVQPVGSGMAVTQEAGAWKFVGDALPIRIEASARAQRTQRIDSAAPAIDYARAIAFEVAALPGLECARVAQRQAGGAAVPLGIYKRHAGGNEAPRSLSLWTRDGLGQGASLDPAVGATRSGDDTWLALPEGPAGDASVRNFYRGGRVVDVALYADPACTTPFSVAGRSSFEVEVAGVPPVWAEMPNLPWPELDASTRSALRELGLASGAAGRLAAAWTFARGPLGLNGATVCGNLGDCGQGGSGRLGEADLRGGALTASVSLRNRGAAVAVDDMKTLALYGRNGEGVGLQSNYTSCPLSAAGGGCFAPPPQAEPAMEAGRSKRSR